MARGATVILPDKEQGCTASRKEERDGLVLGCSSSDRRAGFSYHFISVSFIGRPARLLAFVRVEAYKRWSWFILRQFRKGEPPAGKAKQTLGIPTTLH